MCLCHLPFVMVCRSKHRAFCFTLNNYTDVQIDDFKDFVCQYLVFGKEVGAQGTPHLQGYICFKHPRSFEAVRRQLAPAHVEVAQGSAESNYVYCTKAGDFWEKGVKPASMMPARDRELVGKDAVAAKNKLYMETDLLDLVVAGDLHIGQLPTIKRARMILAAEGKPYHHPGLRGCWYHGPPGTGKSRFAHETYPDAYLKQQNKWFDGYAGEETIVLDDLDTDALGHHLKIWMDRYPCSAETKNGMTQLRHHRFIVTSNYTIEDLFKDKPVMAAAIRRRCDVVHFGEHGFNPHIFDRIEMPEQ